MGRIKSPTDCASYLRFSKDTGFALLLSLLFVLVLSLLVHLPKIASSSEAREIHVVSLMLQDGNYILPRRNEIIPSKPPLFHWLALIIASINGAVTPGLVRLVSVFCGAGTIFITMRLGMKWFGHTLLANKVSPKYIAFSVFLVLATTYGFLKMVFDARVDMCFAFFTTVAVYFGVSRLGEFVSQKFSISNWSLNCFWIACGAAVLTKGPLGVVLPLFLVLVINSFFLQGVFWTKEFLRPCWGWLLMVIIVLSWYILAAVQGGTDFITKQILFENFQRAIGGRYVNSEAWWYYIPSIIVDSFPWSLILVYGVWNLLGRLVKADFWGALALDASDRLRYCGLVGFAFGVLFFSIMSGKRESYLLPLWPVLAIFIGWQLLLWARSFRDLDLVLLRMAAWLHRISWILLVVFLFLLELIKVPFSWSGVYLIVVDWFVMHAHTFQILFLLAMALLVYLDSAKVKDKLIVVALRFGLVFSILVCPLVIRVAIKAEVKGYDQIAKVIDKSVPIGSELGAVLYRHDEFYDPIFFYLDREVKVYREGRFDGLKEPFVLVHRAWWELESAQSADGSSYKPLLTLSLKYDQVCDRDDRDLILLKRSS